MKKLTLFAAIAIGAAAFTSCQNGAPKANLKTNVDSLSYALGYANTQGLLDYLKYQGVDSTKIQDFIKGLKEGVNSGDDKGKKAYQMGLMIGSQVAGQMIPGINKQVFGEDSTKTISKDQFLAGFINGTLKKTDVMDAVKASEIAERVSRSLRATELEKSYGDNKKAGEKFLAENKTKEGVKELPGGVQYKVIKEGNGPIPADTATVKILYEGRTIDGKVFDKQEDINKPATMRVNQAIKGFTEALVHMPVGSIWEIYIPQELAYAENEQASIKPFSALIFKLQLVAIDK